MLDPAATDRLVRAIGAEETTIVAELVATLLTESPVRLAATLGAVDDLASACRQLEAVGLSGDLSTAAGLVAGVETEYDRARLALEEVVA